MRNWIKEWLFIIIVYTLLLFLNKYLLHIPVDNTLIMLIVFIGYILLIEIINKAMDYELWTISY